MLTFIKSIFSKSEKADFNDLIKAGASIIDVRSKREYQDGHLKSSVNIPLNVLRDHMGKIKKNKPVIMCCASGARSAVARKILISQGFSNVYNGGSWTSLRKFVS